jgi:hypothetical protein
VIASKEAVAVPLVGLNVEEKNHRLILPTVSSDLFVTDNVLEVPQAPFPKGTLKFPIGCSVDDIAQRVRFTVPVSCKVPFTLACPKNENTESQAKQSAGAAIVHLALYPSNRGQVALEENLYNLSFALGQLAASSKVELASKGTNEAISSEIISCFVDLISHQLRLFCISLID